MHARRTIDAPRLVGGKAILAVGLATTALDACSIAPTATPLDAGAAVSIAPPRDAGILARAGDALAASVSSSMSSSREGAPDATAGAPTTDANDTTSDASSDAGHAARGNAVDAASARGNAVDAASARATDEIPEGGVDAAGAADLAPAVRYVGRFDMTNPEAPAVDWSDARVLVRFQGVEASVSMTDTTYGGGNAYWDVTVDGVLAPSPLALSQGRAIYTLATGLPAGIHTIELWKRTEANVSTTEIDGFDFGGGTLLAPPAAASKRIEFLGDSVSVGFGDLGTDATCTFAPATEDSHIAFPGLVAIAFGADHQNLAYSGCGVYWDYDRSDPVVFSTIYPATLATASGPTWSFFSFQPDVVWITLGGNDWDQPDAGDPPPPLAAFEAAYDDLVVTVRQVHPAAYIILAIAPSLNDDYPSVPPYNALTSMETALAWELAQHPTDEKLAVFEFARATADQLTGCGSHPGAAEQSLMAQQAISLIASTTGWTVPTPATADRTTESPGPAGPAPGNVPE